MDPIPASELTATISRTIDHHFSKPRPATVGGSFTISKGEREEAERKGLPVIEVPVTPAPAPAHRIKVERDTHGPRPGLNHISSRPGSKHLFCLDHINSSFSESNDHVISPGGLSDDGKG